MVELMTEGLIKRHNEHSVEKVVANAKPIELKFWAHYDMRSSNLTTEYLIKTMEEKANIEPKHCVLHLAIQTEFCRAVE